METETKRLHVHAIQRLLHFTPLDGQKATNPHSRSDSQTPPSSLSSLGAALSPLLLFLFIFCLDSEIPLLQKLHNSREPAPVLYDQSVRQTARLVGRDDTAICYPHNHPIKKEEQAVIDSASTPEREDSTGRGPVNEFWLQKSNDLPAP